MRSIDKYSNTEDAKILPESRDVVQNVGTRKISRWGKVVSKLKRKLLNHFQFLRTLLLFFLLGFLVVACLAVWNFAHNSRLAFYFLLAKNFVFASQDKVPAIDNRVNLLLLGKGGSGHEAPDLTDTIIFVSIKAAPPSVFMVSLPRDIWISSLRAKLNSVYYWGNQKQPGGGLALAKSVVEEIVGQPVQYAIVVDFSGFKRIIDVLGGVVVDVKTSFTDNKYPIAGMENSTCGGDPSLRCRYETVTFLAGKQLMNGEVALKFVRSRNAEGEEGTDLARAARQELVVAAIKDRVLSRETILNPARLLALKEVISESIETDLDATVAAVIARWVVEGRDRIRYEVIPASLLENPPKMPKYDNLYVFIPRSSSPSNTAVRSWIEVQQWIKCKFDNLSSCDRLQD